MLTSWPRIWNGVSFPPLPPQEVFSTSREVTRNRVTLSSLSAARSRRVLRLSTRAKGLCGKSVLAVAVFGVFNFLYSLLSLLTNCTPKQYFCPWHLFEHRARPRTRELLRGIYFLRSFLLIDKLTSHQRSRLGNRSLAIDTSGRSSTVRHVMNKSY
jgi:hypothetical protein